MSNTPHTMIIIIKPDGTMSAQVEGVAGPKCTGLSAWVDQLGQVTEDKNTADYYKPDERENRLTSSY